MLSQLRIVREYIDNKVETLFGTLISSDTGMHGLRYVSGKLQYQDADGVWQDIEATSSGGSSGGDGDNVITDDDIATDEEVNDMFDIT